MERLLKSIFIGSLLILSFGCQKQSGVSASGEEGIQLIAKQQFFVVDNEGARTPFSLDNVSSVFEAESGLVAAVTIVLGEFESYAELSELLSQLGPGEYEVFLHGENEGSVTIFVEMVAEEKGFAFLQDGE